MERGARVYDTFMHPLEALVFRPLRRRLLPRAHGRVLEIGAGTGVNLPLYRREKIEELHLLDVELSPVLSLLAARAGLPVLLHEADAQSLPFADGSFDTVVCTLVFCSVADQARGLSEVRRVLDPGGMLIFIEHVRPPGPVLGRLVEAAAPLWHAMLGPCHLDRDTLAAMQAAGLAVSSGGDGMVIAGIGRPALYSRG